MKFLLKLFKTIGVGLDSVFVGMTLGVRDFLRNLCNRTHPFYSNRDVLRSALVQE